MVGVRRRSWPIHRMNYKGRWLHSVELTDNKCTTLFAVLPVHFDCVSCSFCMREAAATFGPLYAAAAFGCGPRDRVVRRVCINRRTDFPTYFVRGEVLPAPDAVTTAVLLNLRPIVG